MAIGRLSVKVGKAGKAGPHAAYIAREGQYADRLDRGEKLEATEAGNMPAWAQHSPQLFWQAADQFERKNGAAYREFEIALPRELNPEQRLALVREFVAAEIGTRHAYQFAIHTPRAMDGDEQPHAHVMFSERQIDGIDRDPAQYFKRYNGNNPAAGGARKSFAPLESDCDMSTRRGEREAERAQLLQQLRARWEQTCNRHLEMAGETARIDMRSYRDQGLDRTPEPKLLPSETRQPGRRAQVLEFRAEQRAADARSELRAAVPDAGAEIINLAERRAQREREQQLISDAIAARDALYERYRAGPDSQKEIDMADAYGLRYDPRTAAEAESLQRQVDSRMRRLDEIEAEARRAAEAPKPTLADLIQQPQRAPEPQPAPVPKVDTPRPQGTDLSALLGAGNRAAGPSEPLPSPTPSGASGGFPGARRARVPTGSAEADAYVLAQCNSAADQIAAMVEARANAEPVRWHEYESDGERYRRDAEQARDARRVEWLHDGTGEWHAQPQAVIDHHAGRQPEPEQQAQEQKPRDLGRSM